VIAASVANLILHNLVCKWSTIKLLSNKTLNVLPSSILNPKYSSPLFEAYKVPTDSTWLNPLFSLNVLGRNSNALPNSFTDYCSNPL